MVPHVTSNLYRIHRFCGAFNVYLEVRVKSAFSDRINDSEPSFTRLGSTGNPATCQEHFWNKKLFLRAKSDRRLGVR